MDPTARWSALDAVRGLTVAGMLLVNNPGTWDAVYWPLEHAAWHGWTPTDLIFPFFLFIVGVTTELSLGRRAAAGASDREIRTKILSRGTLIVIFGLLLAAFPYVPVSRITDVRIPGVLQRIGVCYAAGALVAWRRSDRTVVLTTILLLVGYWAVLTLISAPDLAVPTIDQPEHTIAAYLDRTLLGSHLWAVTKTWDPEGLLSTISAIATVLLGILAGRMVRGTSSVEGRVNGLFAWGMIGVVAGSVWGWVFPINKNLWTGSYVLFTAGAAAALLALATWLIEVRGTVRWARPLQTFGHNPMVAFLGSGLMARSIGSLITVTVDGTGIPLQRAIYQAGFASWAAPRNASLGYAIAFVVLWYLLLRLLERRGLVLKV